MAISIISLLFFKKQKRENYVFYVKNGEVWFSHTLGINPREITDNLDASGEMTKEDFKNLGRYASQYFRLSENGNYIFFIDEVDEEDDGVYSYQYVEETDTVVYLTYYSTKNKSGTLNTYCKGKNVEIGDDVHRFSITKGGEIIYLCDYDLDDYEGELYVYRNNKSKFIDDEVNCIIPYSYYYY